MLAGRDLPLEDLLLLARLTRACAYFYRFMGTFSGLGFRVFLGFVFPARIAELHVHEGLGFRVYGSSSKVHRHLEVGLQVGNYGSKLT